MSDYIPPYLVSFPEPSQWNGSDTRELGRSNGHPERRACRDCAWTGKGIRAQVAHWKATGHRIVHGSDPKVTR